MRLALAEMRRSKGKYLSVTAAVGFIVFLVLILAGLADGLYYGATGAFRSAEANVYVFDEDAQRSLVRSELDPTTVDSVLSVPGVSDAGPIGIQLGSATIGDEPIGVALVGTEPGRPGAPVDLTPYPAGATPIAVADASLQSTGLEAGDFVVLTGATTPVEIVDFVDDSMFLLAGTLWTDIGTWSTVRTEIIPELAFRGDTIQAVAATIEPGADATVVASAVDAAVGGTEAVSTDEAISSLPGVEQQASTFQSIIFTSFAVVGLVTALFFALITLEKRGQIAVLKAIGSTNRSLLSGIVAQGIATGVAGFAIGYGLSRAVGAAVPADVPVTFLQGTATSLLFATLAMAAAGAALSFRRVSKIDPASALGGGI